MRSHRDRSKNRIPIRPTGFLALNALNRLTKRTHGRRAGFDGWGLPHRQNPTEADNHSARDRQGFSKFTPVVEFGW